MGIFFLFPHFPGSPTFSLRLSQPICFFCFPPVRRKSSKNIYKWNTGIYGHISPFSPFSWIANVFLKTVQIHFFNYRFPPVRRKSSKNIYKWNTGIYGHIFPFSPFSWIANVFLKTVPIHFFKLSFFPVAKEIIKKHIFVSPNKYKKNIKKYYVWRCTSTKISVFRYHSFLQYISAVLFRYQYYFQAGNRKWLQPRE